MAAKRLQLDKHLEKFSDGTSLSYVITKPGVELFHDKEKRFSRLKPAHWATVMFPRAVDVYLPLGTDTGELDKKLHMPAGTTVRGFFAKVSAFMRSKVSKADAHELTAGVGYANSASVLGAKYNQLPMDHVFYEGFWLKKGKRFISLGS